MKMLVTGGAGFIGSNFARHVLERAPEDEVVVLDKLTYAGRVETIQDLIDGGRLRVRAGRHRRPGRACATALEGCDAVVNFAAESHVDRSIEEPGHFIQTDVYGTYVLLEEARARRHRALPAGLDRRGLRLDRGGLVHRAEPARPLLPVLGLEGRRRPGRVAPTATPTGWTRSSAARRTTTAPTSTRRS